MKSLLLAALILLSMPSLAQLDSSLPVRGFCISAPKPAELSRFLEFIEGELAPRHINSLVLRVDFNYQYQSHPELRDSIALAPQDVRQLVTACKKAGIRMIPQINLLGHQSWASKTAKLLEVYPQFDETPSVKMPEVYQWPNADSLYCKSYCPLHPDVHRIVFDLVDEICSAFETDAFHAGMDEVFYIGDSRCPRCHGKNKAQLFADEVNKIHQHLAGKGRELWIWGDRLIDGKTTGLGMWEASLNNTDPAIDLIDPNVMICDWHYERADKTAVYFAMKGLRVITCPWREPEVAMQQAIDLKSFRQGSTPEMKNRFAGMMQTVWSGVSPFLDGFYSNRPDDKQGNRTPWATFRAVFGQ